MPQKRMECFRLLLEQFGSLLATASGVSEVPLGRVWPFLPHLVSNPLGVCWQLHWGFSECPLGRVWPSLPHLVSNPLGVCWQLLRGFSECPLGRVWPSLPHLVSTVWKSAGNCSGTQTQLS